MQNRKKNITRFALLALILLAANILSAKFSLRFDLTKEKRFSLSNGTKQMLKNLKEPATIKVLLEGKFPAGFQNLQNRTTQVLSEFQNASNGKVRFTFENPLEGKSDEEKVEVYEQLQNSFGINPVNLQVQEDESKSQQIVFPAAIVSHNGKDIPVNLLENHQGMSPLEILEYAGTQLEYKFARSIKNAAKTARADIAYITGQGQDLGWNTFDMLGRLGMMYNLDTIDINQNIEIPQHFKAIIICGPKEEIDNKAKFKLDQYIMQGGRVLWFIDQLETGMTDLEKQNAYLSVKRELNLEDMLFKYGVRINPDLIEDLQLNLPIPITVGEIGGRPDIQLLPWVYFPNSVPTSPHPIVKNMDGIMFQFASSMDTIANDIKKTVLLHSSNRSRKVAAPVRVSLSDLRFKPKVELFKEKDIPMAVLLEGKFESVFTNRLDPKFMETYTGELGKKFLPTCERDNKMIVVSNAAVFHNDVSEKTGPLETGFYKYTKQTYGNRNFILNALEYLTDDDNILDARGKDLSVRVLDMKRVKNEKLNWQALNIGLPILLTLLFASAFLFFRKKKYTGKVS